MTSSRTGEPASRGDSPLRGRGATRPGEIPWRGWKDIAWRVKDQLAEDNLSIVAAGVAFYALLALFPAIAAIVSVYGLAFDPGDVASQIEWLASLMPAQAAQILTDQVQQFVGTASDKLGLAVIFGFVLTLWSATAGIKTLFVALDIVYDERETRSFIRFNLLALGMTFGAILFAVVSFALVVAIPIALNFIGLGSAAEFAISALRWPILAVCVSCALAVVYRYGPDRQVAQWRWLNWGAIGATVLWLVASMLFSFYISNFGNYDKTYGSLGAVIILMMWIYVSAYVVLLGAEVNSEIEHQTSIDSTAGDPKPMGERGAYVADTVGAARD